MATVRRSYDEEFKRHLVSEVESGEMSQVDVSKEYGVSKTLVKLWLTEYGRFRPKRDVVEIVMKSEKEKIAELEKALAEAHLKLRVYDEIMNIAGKKYKVDLKKTFGTSQSVSSAEMDTKLKPSAKR